jgi:hypothetical protein
MLQSVSLGDNDFKFIYLEKPCSKKLSDSGDAKMNVNCKKDLDCKIHKTHFTHRNLPLRLYSRDPKIILVSESRD